MPDPSSPDPRPDLHVAGDGDGDGQVVQTAQQGRLLAEVSTAMVRIYKEDFGRGPTRTVSYFAGPDAIVCVLRDTMTRAERRLVDIGEAERVRETRLALQHASADRFRQAVEEVTGREVESFVSGVDVFEDLSIEFLSLKPATSG
jgi:uncharacterized protein YbcI